MDETGALVEVAALARCVSLIADLCAGAKSTASGNTLAERVWPRITA
jgi:hypothetical protein